MEMETTLTTSNFLDSTSSWTWDASNKDLIVNIVFTILGIVGILGNVLVLAVISLLKELRTFMNILIANQSLIDLITSLLVFLHWLSEVPVNEENKVRAFMACTVINSKYLFWSAIVSSTFNLVVLTLERYLAVMHPIKYKRATMKRRTIIVVALAPWLLGFGFQTYSTIPIRAEGTACITKISDRALIALGVISFFVQYLFPLLVMIFVYVRLVMSLRNRVAHFNAPGIALRMSGCGSHAQSDKDYTRAPLGQNALPLNVAAGGRGAVRIPNYRDRARKNIVKTLLIVSVTFAVCWTPNQIMYLNFNLGGYLDFESGFYYFSVILAFCNMCINPFIYAFKYRRFKKGVKKLFFFAEV
ncbi:galanin receptor 2a-like [Diadema setosum]|uniref:galanin receptor 2a-like n=1 Tax=Diadema setosum TaxID=31175 RepID=UPI003B3A9B72